MSKGGGSTQTSTTTIPQWMQDAAKENLAKARDVSQIGYVPNYGLDVAAFSPMQQQAMQASGMAGQAFGLAPQGFDATAGIPTPVTNSLGFTGYSSGNMFDQALNELAQRRPGQYAAQATMFVDPLTGDTPMTYDNGRGFVNTRNMSSPTAFGFANQGSDGSIQTSGGSSADYYRNMTPGTENFWLGRAVSEYPVWAPGGLINAGLKLAGGKIIDNRLDAIADQFGIYDNLQPGQMVKSDANGNLQVVADPNYVAPSVQWSPSTTWSGGSTSGGSLYSGGDTNWASGSDWSNSGTGFTSDPFA